MEWAPCKLLIIDTTDHSLLLIDSAKDEVLVRLPYPGQHVPTALVLSADSAKAYLPTVDETGSGSLFVANLTACSLYRLPVSIPHPQQFTMAPDGQTAYLADPGGTLYALNISLLTVKELGQPDSDTCCVGIAADENYLYTCWELPSGGIVAIFDAAGTLRKEYAIAGTPTNITLSAGRILIPFTDNNGSGEGLSIIRTDLQDDSAALTTQELQQTGGIPIYPCSITVADDQTTAYIANEDSSSITILDLDAKTVLGYIPVGHSISNVYLLPDSRFAVATSNMFADLLFIDLVNQRLLSLSSSDHEIANSLAVLPNK